jgi:cell division protein FtsL
MIAQRFRAIAWVAGCAFAALCCYLASQSVAAERAALARVDRDIAHAEDDIRRLNTEIAARSRMAQIERWNTQVLALQAPAPAQFVANEVQLASLAGGKSLPLDQAVMASKGAVTTVAYQPAAPKPAAVPVAVATATAPVVQQPLLRPATFVQPKPGRLDPAAAPQVVKASLTRVAPTPKTIDLDDPAPVAKTKPVEKKAEPIEKKADNKTDKKAEPAQKRVEVAEPKPVKKPGALASAGLLPADLGKLIAAERKGGKASRSAGDR